MASIKPTKLIKFKADISLATMKMPFPTSITLPILTPNTLDKEELATQNYTSLRFLPAVSTVTVKEELLYIDMREKAVYRLRKDMTTNQLISTGSWRPRAVHSSRINGNILLGMNSDNDMKIVRYSRKGRKLQDILRDDKPETLPLSLFYIMENINGDICTSAYDKVVVLTRSGEYKFSYNGHKSQSRFRSYGICTDVLGYILMYNGSDLNHSSVHLLDQFGRFISFILTPDQCPYEPCALCVDDHHNL
ncbi:uncharacterized protein LOC133203488 [Saccostrea echinata]|uniref:uncharacterized protein LOC133203488 n=1 Tax=Saccostrea echinata TaxID=191078 RepID=UPI002A80D6B4|nr:uncharacterized protein LOC133203488 [Saccostrea echinata]